jgi:hypothetical protein
MDNKKYKWTKPYKGPFHRYELETIINKHMEQYTTTVIVNVSIRRRFRGKKQCVCTAACGAGKGHNEMYDLYIKVVK